MNASTYKLLSTVIRAFIVKSSIQGNQELFNEEYSICVANHLGSFGPMALYSNFSRKLYPWVTHEILDQQKCALYLREDFVESELRLKFPFSPIISNVLGKICVSLMLYLQAIPVYKNSKRIIETIDTSLAYLKAGKTLLIFPETEESKTADDICFLNPGFVKLAKLFFMETGEIVRFLPLSVNKEARCIAIGEPVLFDPHACFNDECLRIIGELENRISEMYISCSDKAISSSENRAVS